MKLYIFTVYLIITKKNENIYFHKLENLVLHLEQTWQRGHSWKVELQKCNWHFRRPLIECWTVPLIMQPKEAPWTIILLFYVTGWGTTIYWEVPSSETTYDNKKQLINVNAHSFWAVVTLWYDNYKCFASASAAVVTKTKRCFE